MENNSDPVNVLLERFKLIFQIAVLIAALYVIIVGERERVQTTGDVANILKLTKTISQEVAQPVALEESNEQ